MTRKPSIAHFFVVCILFLPWSVVWSQTTAPLASAQEIGEPLIVGSNSGVFVNDTILGANRWTSIGFTGTGAILANVEGGWAWASTAANPNRHETLPVGRVSQFLAGPGALTTAGAFQSHATACTMLMGGVGTQNTQKGMSSTSTLWTGNIATSISGSSFNAPYSSTAPLYRDVIRDGVAAAGGVRANIVSSSWGFGGSTGNNDTTRMIDAVLYESRVDGVRGAGLFCVAAGNSGPNENTIISPAAGFNGLVVGALTSDSSNPQFGTAASFSSRGRQSYFNPNNSTTMTLARNRVDIAAPGTSLTVAAMQTGGVDGGPSNLYGTNGAGTSYATPLTAGGIALMVGAAKSTLFVANPDAVDGRVLKAVVMNSATKTVGWTNNASSIGGVWQTTEALDRATGAGRLNLNRAFDQYVPIANGGQAGTTDVAGLASGNLGSVAATGWDFGRVQLSGTTTNNYRLPTLLAATTLTATLSWYADNTISDFTQNNGTSTTFGHFLDLNLFLYVDNGGVPGTLVASSISNFNSSEHIFFTLPSVSQSYVLQVAFNAANTQDYNFDNTTSELYGLAWSGTPVVVVPEPATLGMLATAALAGATYGYYKRRGREGADEIGRQ